MYAHETPQGKEAIRKRNLTAKFYGCVHGFNTVINPDPMAPIAISFQRGGKTQELAIVRNRSETRSQFSWPSILITSSKIDELVSRALRLGVAGKVIVGMADDSVLVWTIVNENGETFAYPRYVSKTKGDCMASHFAERQNTHLPVSVSEVFEPMVLV